jgi:hypothetical protein
MGKGKNNEEHVDISQDIKSKVQLSQDNRDPMVKKLDKGATVTCYKCHGEGHKFYKYPQFVKKLDKVAKKKLNPTIKGSLIYTKPNRKNKIKGNTYVIKKMANGKVVAHKVGKMKEEQGWNQHEKASNGLGTKGHLKAMSAGTWEIGTKNMRRFKPISQACKFEMCCPRSPVEVMETRTYLMYYCSSIALSRFAFVALPCCFHMVGCLCHVLTHEQPTWFDYCVGKLHLFFHGACFLIYLFAS